MPEVEGKERHAERAEQRCEQLNAAIGTRVLDALGRPGNLVLAQVKRLWDGHYRANVLVGENAASAKVAHSYFLEVDSEGNIVTCTPRIARSY